MKMGDLTISFDGDVSLNILVNSSGYESWNAGIQSETKHVWVVATPGGELAVFEQIRA